MDARQSQGTGSQGARDLSRDATVGEAAAAMGAGLEGDAGAVFARVSTDSRTLAAGDLFFCLKGPNFDAHDFVAEAVRLGAAGVVVESARAAEAVRAAAGGATAVLAVPDTLAALGALATWHRRGFDGRVVAVTGSNGKTTTKEMLRGILAAHYGSERVLATQGNLNNLVGVPLTLFGLGPGHAAAVVEMGMNAPGEIARLVRMGIPDVGLITCVAAAHLEGVGSIEGVALAKGELFEGLPPGAVAVVNADDPRVVGQAPRFAGRRLSFGHGTGIEAEAIVAGRVDAVSFDLVAGGERARVDLPVGGRHNVPNALGAAACGLALGIPLRTVAAGLTGMKPPPMRMAVERLPNGVTVINDAYNANPGSLAAGIAALGDLDCRRILVVGDMRELGETAAALHRDIGRRAAAIAPALVCACGEYAPDVVAGAREAGLGAGVALVCARHEDAADAVARSWRAGDAVLVKGSRGSAMEKVVEALRRRAGAAAGPAEGAH